MTRDEPWTAGDYVVIDIEGNGARPPELVELAVVPVRGGVIGDVRAWLVRPPTPITWHARQIHGISDDDVVEAPSFDDIASDVLGALGEAIPVGHAVHNDLAVLRRVLPGWQPRFALDTLRLARRALDLPSYGLGALVEHYDLGVGLPAGMRAHRADYDALVTARLLVKLATALNSRGATLAELRHAAGTTSAATAVGPTLLDLL
ncbi:PolC-type DNA polymerase III [Promicromonospora iranensis]|uniref:DNA polymerase III epsilon subunit-like protein n=1 Tax=Promicromonospora iranensis TaxID=1105144 RepID=A0ABU2CIJ6_9MICO|nr:3'-5' exonuclease [Promicromonospora iranensis]MDR7381151.1 DNA polymerase III epsilon subunit-like protein [Promicromonospora iranensis]